MRLHALAASREIEKDRASFGQARLFWQNRGRKKSTGSLLSLTDPAINAVTKVATTVR